jgi:hypothetical protein
VRQVFRYGSELYESYRASEKIALFEDHIEGHGYQRRKREAAYGWFLRWLMQKGDGRAVLEPATETTPIDAAELRCFAEGRNEPAGPAIVATVEQLARDLPPVRAGIELDRVLGLPRVHGPNALQIEDRRLQRLSISAEPGLELPAFLLMPAGEVKGLVVALDDRGKEALASEPWFAEALPRGWAICGIDPRGVGELATSKPGWIFAVSLLLGENFVGRQAWDLERAIVTLNDSEAFRGKPVGLYARGHNVALAATYALARAGAAGQPEIRWYVLRDAFVSLRAFFERPESLSISYRLQAEDRDRTTSFDREIPASYFAFDALRSFDLPQLLESSRAQGLFIDPIDGDWHPLATDKARKILPQRVRAVTSPAPNQSMQRFLEFLETAP